MVGSPPNPRLPCPPADPRSSRPGTPSSASSARGAPRIRGATQSLGSNSAGARPPGLRGCPFPPPAAPHRGFPPLTHIPRREETRSPARLNSPQAAAVPAEGGPPSRSPPSSPPTRPPPPLTSAALPPSPAPSSHTHSPLGAAGASTSPWNGRSGGVPPPAPAPA